MNATSLAVSLSMGRAACRLASFRSLDGSGCFLRLELHDLQQVIRLVGALSHVGSMWSSDASFLSWTCLPHR